MCAVILLFAFIMSMVINLVERMIIHHNRQSQDTRSEETMQQKVQETLK